MSDVLEQLKEESLRLARGSFDSVDCGLAANVADAAIEEIERLRGLTFNDAQGSLTQEDIYANCWTTLIGFSEELTERDRKFICDQVARKVILAAQPPAAPVEMDADLPTYQDVRGILGPAPERSSADAPVETDKIMDAILHYLVKECGLIFDDLTAADFAHIRGLISGARPVPRSSAANGGELDFNDPLTSKIMGAARLHTHDHTMAYSITREVLSVVRTEPQAAPESSKRDDQEVRTEHGVIKNGRYFNTGKTYWPDGTVKFDFDRSNELDPWFNGTISNDGFINDHD